MVLSMPQPYKHPKTGVYWYRKVVPKPLRATIGKREIKRSLKTKDPTEAKRVHVEVAAEVERYLQAQSSVPTSLTNYQITALGGVLYSETVSRMAEDPGSPGVWEQLERLDAQARAKGKLEQWYGEEVDRLLTQEGLNVDQISRERLLVAASDALLQAVRHLRRNASGDYRPDPDGDRFPEWRNPSAERPNVGPGGTIEELLARWWKEAEQAGRSVKTYEAYSGVARRFIEHLGHSDPRRVSPEDVVAYKDAKLDEVNPRTGKTISPKTVKDTDLAALKTLFGWAKSNRIISTNPAQGITLKLGKRRIIREKGFTDEEAKLLLNAATTLVRTKESEKVYLAKRWAPLICAYTGARIGEVVQLRKQDVQKRGGHWVITITPEAGTTKSGNARQVVMHEHLVTLGFPAFVEGSADGYLFANVKPGKSSAGALKSVQNRVREWSREIVTDPNVQPNHGWRHRFKTKWREAGLDPYIANVIQDHDLTNSSDRYGDNTLKAQSLALAKFPVQF